MTRGPDRLQQQVHREMREDLDATAALTRLAELLPDAVTSFQGAFYVSDTRSFQTLPEKRGTWRKVAHLGGFGLHWCTDPVLTATVIRQAMGYAGADFCLSSHDLTFMAQFKKKGSGGDPVTARADSEVLAVARAAVQYLEARRG